MSVDIWIMRKIWRYIGYQIDQLASKKAPLNERSEKPTPKMQNIAAIRPLLHQAKNSRKRSPVSLERYRMLTTINPPRSVYSRTRDAQPHYYIAPPSANHSSHPTAAKKKRKEEHLLWKHTNNTPTQSLMTNPTNPLIINHNTPITPLMPAPVLTKREPRLGPHAPDLPQPLGDPTLGNNRVRGADPTPEVKLQVRHGQRLGDQRQGASGWKAGAVAGEEFEGGLVLRFLAVGRGEVEGEQSVVD